MWDERDLPQQPKRPTGHDMPTQRGSSDNIGRVTGTSPVVRADGTLFMPPGTLFQEKYQVIEILGEGTISVAHKARHSVMKNTVVVKLLKGTYPSNSRAVLRFQREGQAASRLNHQNIVRTFELGLSREGQPFLAIEFFDGKSLAALLREHGAPPLATGISIVAQIVDGLSSAHAAGFTHRGLKPSNIFVTNLGTPNPQVKILDFGLADVFDEEEDGSKRVAKGGKFFGHPQYMSPEQCLGKTLDDRTDIYSLGCIMYEVFTGVPAIAPGPTMEVMNRNISMPPRPFREVAPNRPELARLEPIVMKCLAKDPGARYQTLAQLARALQDHEEEVEAESASNRVVDNSAELAAEEAERQRGQLIQRVVIAAVLVLLMVPIGAAAIFKMSQVEVAQPGPAEKGAFALDRGQYEEAQKQITAQLDGARKASRKSDVVRLLGQEALLEHILANKDAEAKADKELTDINDSEGFRVYVDAAQMEAVDALLASDKSNEELETALKEPVQKMLDITQSLAWSQQYAPAQEAMALLIDKLSRKLGNTSKMVVDLKLQYASRLLQKIVNPPSHLNLKQQQELVGEPMTSLETPMSQSEGSSLLVAKINFALAQAISGKSEDSKKLLDEVMADYKNQGAENITLIEARIADTNVALGDPAAALPLYKSAYQKFLGEKKYAQASYCAGAFSRSFWLADQVKDGYDFLSGELDKSEVSDPQAAILKSELQAQLAQLDFWIATAGDTVVKKFFPDRDAVKKSSGDLRHDAERLALESLISTQSTRPSELWLSSPALETLAKMYYDGDTVGRSIPLLRLKAALAQRTNNARENDFSRANLGSALYAYTKVGMAGLYTSYDKTQISIGSQDPAGEAKALYEQCYAAATAPGETSYFWLDKWFGDLAGKYIDNDAVKVVLLTACRKSSNNLGDVFGKTSDEYLLQLRGLAQLSAALNRTAETKTTLGEALEVAGANSNLPLLDRLYIYDDMLRFCQKTNDQAGTKKYTAELAALGSKK